MYFIASFALTLVHIDGECMIYSCCESISEPKSQRRICRVLYELMVTGLCELVKNVVMEAFWILVFRVC